MDRRSRSRSPRRSRSRSRSPRRRYSRSPSPRRRSPRRARGPVQGSVKDRENTTCIFVGNLSYRIRERDLSEMFDRYGRIRQATIGRDRRTGDSRGYGFVEFEDRRDAEDAFDRMHSYEVDGRRLRLDWDIGLNKKQDLGYVRAAPAEKRSPRRSRSPPRRNSRSPPRDRRSRTPERNGGGDSPSNKRSRGNNE